MYRERKSVFFNQTCINEEMLLKYTHILTLIYILLLLLLLANFYLISVT